MLARAPHRLKLFERPFSGVYYSDKSIICIICENACIVEFSSSLTNYSELMRSLSLFSLKFSKVEKLR